MNLLIILIILGICYLWYNTVRIRRFNKIYAEAQVLKKNARADGVLCKSPYTTRQEFLDYMGQFFKYKKHEWVFIAFLSSKSIDQFWINKGDDSEGVSPYIGISEVKKICQENGYNHILVGHNHPSGALSPSNQDRAFLEEYMDSLNDSNISVEHLVFVSGNWRKYGLSVGQYVRRLFIGPTRML